MRWGVTIYGHPVSWDAAYRTGKMPVSRTRDGRKVPVLDEKTGRQRTIFRPRLTDEAQQWADDVYRQVITVRPSNWRPVGQIRLTWELFLAHDMDDDNALKIARDSIAKAIGIDDMRFLSCTKSKETVSDPREARIIVTFDDQPHPHG